jgi:hypothetical protein
MFLKISKILLIYYDIKTCLTIDSAKISKINMSENFTDIIVTERLSIIRDLSSAVDITTEKKLQTFNTVFVNCMQTESVQNASLYFNITPSSIAAIIMFYYIKLFTYSYTTQNLSTTQIPNTQNGSIIINNVNLDNFMLMILYCYYKNTVGCFMIKGSKSYQLNDCEFYNQSFENQSNCSCGSDILNKQELSKCDNSDECLKPYCIGSNNCAPISTCATEPSQTLYKCTSSDFGKEDYVYYNYVDKTIMNFVTENISLYLQTTSEPEKENSTFSIILIILAIIIIISLLIIVFLFLKK